MKLLKIFFESMEKVVRRICQLMSVIAVVFLMAMMFLTVADVVLRYLTNTPIKGSYELMEAFVICAGILGIAWCGLKGGHLKVDVLINRFSNRAQKKIDVFTFILSLTVVPLVAWVSFLQMRETYLSGSSSMLLDIPVFPFVAVIGIGFTLLTFVLLILVVHSFSGIFKK